MQIESFWGAMDVTYCKVREGNQVNINLSDIIISIQHLTVEDRGQKKHLHFSVKEKRTQRGQGYPTSSCCSLGFIALKHTPRQLGGMPVSAGIMEIGHKVQTGYLE